MMRLCVDQIGRYIYIETFPTQMKEAWWRHTPDENVGAKGLPKPPPTYFYSGLHKNS
jgi:hypothetical protein